MRRSAFLAFVALTLFAGLAACSEDSAPPTPPAPPKSVADHFDIRVGDKLVHLQLAVTASEEQRGLMERRDLRPDEGMLFVYARPQQMHFWMHDTPTALDIGFFDSGGVLREIYPMQPFDESTVNSRSDQIQFPLEMNQGWFARNSVRPGAQLDLQALAAALKARGFDPGKYGLSPSAP